VALSARPAWLLAGLATLGAAGLTRDAWLLFRTPIALGTDGYYYIILAQHLLADRVLYYPTRTPAVLWLIAAVTRAIGNPIDAVKICALIFDIVLAGAIAGLMLAVTRRGWCAALAAVLVLLPAMHLFLLIEFVKNLGALAMIAVAALCAVRARGHGRRRAGWPLAAVAAGAIAVASHGMAWVAVPAMAMLYGLAALMLTRPAPRDRVVGAIAAVLVVWIATAALAWLPLPASLGAEVLPSPAFPIRLANPTGTIEAAMLLVAAPVGLWVYATGLSASRSVRMLIGITALWTLMVTVNPCLNHTMRDFGIIARFDHAAFVQVALLVPALLFAGIETASPHMPLALAATAATLTAACVTPLPYGARHEFLAARAHLIASLHNITLPPHAQVIAPHGDEFVLTWCCGVDGVHEYRETMPPRPTYWLIQDGAQISLIPHEELLRLDAQMDADERQRLRVNNSHWNRFRQRALLTR
jgi:hypothetical protein